MTRFHGKPGPAPPRRSDPAAGACGRPGGLFRPSCSLRILRVGAAALIAFGGGGLAACTPEREYEIVVHRFVDEPDVQPEASATPPGEVSYDHPTRYPVPSGQINDEARYVLLEPVETIPVNGGLPIPLTVTENGPLRVAFSLPPELAGSAAVVVKMHLKREGQAGGPLAPQVGRPDARGWVRLTLPVLGVKGEKLEIRLHLRPAAPSRRVTKGPVSIPERAFLEFGYGVEPVGWHPEAPPVTFRVSLESREKGREAEVLFERRLDPARRAPDRRWHEARIDLAALAGQGASFTFEQIIESEGPAATYPLISNPTILRVVDEHPRNTLNFILISLDTLRAQELGTYGYELDSSPFLDEMARESAVVFENASTTSVSTPPAHMSMFTGLLPSVHGHTTGLEALPMGMVTVSEILRGAGYETGAVTEDGWLGAEHGFARGINSYKENKSADIMAPTGQVDQTLHDARTWLERHGRRKFFLFIHTFQVHGPFSPPPAYQDLFEPYLHGGKHYEPGEKLPANLIDQRNYDREIRYTDTELRRFFEGLEELGLDRSTVVVITSDHGEEFGEHGHLGHAAHLYDEILRVPLIVWGPGTVAGPRRIAIPVSVLDLTQTILDLAGLPGVAGLQGVSLAEVLTDAGARPPGDRSLYAEAWGGFAKLADGRQDHTWKSPAFTVRKNQYKYVMRGLSNPKEQRFELFDLGADPGERRNLLGTGPDPWPAGREALLSYAREMGKIRAAILSGSPLAPAKGPITLDPEREEKLRALGYIQ